MEFFFWKKGSEVSWHCLTQGLKSEEIIQNLKGGKLLFFVENITFYDLLGTYLSFWKKILIEANKSTFCKIKRDNWFDPKNANFEGWLHKFCSIQYEYTTF